MNESERYSPIGGGGVFDFPNWENQILWFLWSFTLDFSSNLANTYLMKIFDAPATILPYGM